MKKKCTSDIVLLDTTPEGLPSVPVVPIRPPPAEVCDNIAWEGHDLTIKCIVCQRPDNESCLLLCDGLGCSNACHTCCCPTPLYSIPHGKWFCSQCQAAGQADQPKEISRHHGQQGMDDTEGTTDMSQEEVAVAAAVAEGLLCPSPISGAVYGVVDDDMFELGVGIIKEVVVSDQCVVMHEMALIPGLGPHSAQCVWFSEPNLGIQKGYTAWVDLETSGRLQGLAMRVPINRVALPATGKFECAVCALEMRPRDPRKKRKRICVASAE